MDNTLGRRIVEVFDYRLAGESESERRDRLRALAARATAAERLAKAVVCQDIASDAWHDAGVEDVATRILYDNATMEYERAFAAWRAIEGEVTG